jgi:serine/threonine-protein kinase
MVETPRAGPPERIGRYEIQREVGRGAMGVVYQARDLLLARHVALKTIAFGPEVTPDQRRGFERRFLQEARAAAALGHPSIVVVYDVGADEDSGLVYMALELLEGQTLEGVLAAGALPARDALGIAAQLADALDHAHQHGVVHRDVKPANVMRLPSGTAKLMDFGVAKLEASHLTAGRQRIGSPYYMSPEQAQGTDVDARSDLFSLGAVLYEMVTGRRAFPGASVSDVLMRVAYEDPAAPSRLVPGLLPGVDEIVAHALAKAPGERYASAAALREDLEDVLDGRPPRHASAATPRSGPATLTARDAPATATEATLRAGLETGPLELPNGRRISLVILEGARRGETFTLERPRVLIGRSGGGFQADLEVPDPEVSRAHALIECYGARVILRDVGSRNGTYVGTLKVEEHELEDKEEFRVGRTRLMLVVSDAR